jgi:hypothetical protein
LGDWGSNEPTEAELAVGVLGANQVINWRRGVG